MNSRVVKFIAMAAMLVDHIGMVLFPDHIIFRVVGRIAMPLFCFLIAYGVTKTRNIFKYFLRLFVFAIVVQLWLNFVISGNLFEFEQLNVFFTLAIGVLTVGLIKKCRIFAIGLVCVMFVIMTVMIIDVFVPVDYSGAGVLLIVLFYLGLKHLSLNKAKIAAFFSLAVFNLVLEIVYGYHIQWFSMFEFFVIVFFVDQKLKISVYEKWAFYVFYPLHLTILYLI